METSQRLILLSLNLTIFLKSSEGPKTKVTSNFKRKEKKKRSISMYVENWVIMQVSVNFLNLKTLNFKLTLLNMK